MSTDFFNSAILPHQGIIIKICRAYTHTQEDFEDYYQEVCLQIWQSRDRFAGQAEWSTWIYRLTLNVCLTLQKKKKRASTGLAAHHTQWPVIEQENIPDTTEIERLYHAIRQLKEIDRAIILLYLEEKTYQDIASIMGTNVSNIGARINRIKKRLKTILYEKIN